MVYLSSGGGSSLGGETSYILNRYIYICIYTYTSPERKYTTGIYTTNIYVYIYKRSGAPSSEGGGP